MLFPFKVHSTVSLHITLDEETAQKFHIFLCMPASPIISLPDHRRPPLCHIERSRDILTVQHISNMLRPRPKVKFYYANFPLFLIEKVLRWDTFQRASACPEEFDALGAIGLKVIKIEVIVPGIEFEMSA